VIAVFESPERVVSLFLTFKFVYPKSNIEKT